MNLQRAIRHVVGPATVLACAVALLAMPAASADTVTNPAPPVLTSPADDPNASLLPSKALVLTWTAVSGATGYQVQMTPNGDWTNNTVTLPNSGKTVATRYAPSVTLPHASYFWRVRALVSGGNVTAWSLVRTLTRGWPDGPSTMTSPTASDPRFAWTSVKWASSYQLQVSKDPSFSFADPSTVVCNTNHTTYAPYDLKAGTEVTPGDCFPRNSMVDATTYYWRVIALDGTRQEAIPADVAPSGGGYGCEQVPECSLGSGTPSFLYTAPADALVPPAAPTGLATAGCAAGVCYDTPSLTWTPVATATYYNVRVAVDAAFSNIQRTYETSGSAVTPRDSYLDNQAGRAYYWYVRACNTSGCGASSLVGNFKKASEPATVSLPANGAKLTSGQVTFQWQDFQQTNVGVGHPAQEAMDYRLQLASDALFETGIQTFNNIDLTEFTNPAALLGDGTYFWRVQPYDQSGNPLTWSAARSFSVDTKAPTFALSGTMSGRSAVTLTASESVSGVTPSTLGVRTVSSSTAIHGSLVNLSATRWSFTPTSPWVAGEFYRAWASAAVQDGVGNSVSSTGAAKRASTTVDSSSSALTKTSGDASWHTSTASDARGGSFVWSTDRTSTAARSSVSTKVAGTRVYFDGCVSPSSGRANVYIDGKLAVTLNLHRKSSSCHQVWASATLSNKQHTVKISVLGTHVKRSSGTTVSVDAIRVR